MVGDLPSLAAGATRWNHAPPPTDMEGKDVGQLVRNWVDVVSGPLILNLPSGNLTYLLNMTIERVEFPTKNDDFPKLC